MSEYSIIESHYGVTPSFRVFRLSDGEWMRSFNSKREANRFIKDRLLLNAAVAPRKRV